MKVNMGLLMLIVPTTLQVMSYKDMKGYLQILKNKQREVDTGSIKPSNIILTDNR